MKKKAVLHDREELDDKMPFILDLYADNPGKPGD